MSSVWMYSYLIYAYYYYSAVKAFPMNEDTTMLEGEDKSTISTLKQENQSSVISSIGKKYIMAVPEIFSKVRIKRQSGAGKFAEAAKMPQVKLLRLVLQMIKNTWDTVYVGGTHPLHPNVPKAVVALYKEKVVEFFLPDVGIDPTKI